MNITHQRRLDTYPYSMASEGCETTTYRLVLFRFRTWGLESNLRRACFDSSYSTGCGKRVYEKNIRLMSRTFSSDRKVL